MFTICVCVPALLAIMCLSYLFLGILNALNVDNVCVAVFVIIYIYTEKHYWNYVFLRLK